LYYNINVSEVIIKMIYYLT